MGARAPRRRRYARRVRIGIVGSGVIGLSAAHELATAGHAVTVFDDRPLEARVSVLAAALWFPFEAYPLDRVEGWSARSCERFVALAVEPGSGVRMAEGDILVRDPGTFDDSWRAWVPGIEPAEPSRLPDGVVAGFTARLPVIEMPVYLAWLEARCRGLGVRFAAERVERLDALDGVDAIVVAGGLESGRLLGGDALVHPVRGQVVRLENPGLERWLLDEQHPDGLTYVFPRSGDVVCGGTATRSDDLAWDAATEAAILARARQLVPELEGAAVRSRAVGLRPGRDEVRLEFVPDAGEVPVIACYGHGGAGVTTSWGCAEEVAGMVEALRR